MYTITFKQGSSRDIKALAALGDNILQVAQRAEVNIDAPCSGSGTCGKCKLLLVSGDVSITRNSHLSNADYEDGWRLACQSYVSGNAMFLLPSTAEDYKSGIQTADFSTPEELERYEKTLSEIFEYGFEKDCRLETISVKMTPPSMDDTTPDNERLIRTVMKLVDVGIVHMSNNALGHLPFVLRENNYNVKCLLKKGKGFVAIMDVFSNEDNEPLCGLAVDIGTTTVAAALIDLKTGKILERASAGNAQIRYGADVINRIIQSSKPGGRERLKKAIREDTLFPLIRKMCKTAGIDPERVCRVVIASNTTMNHLFAGVPASSIRLEPYVPVFRELPGLIASEFGIPVHQEARVIFAPNVGSYVGGDITAGAFASMIWNKPELSLLIDLGTNGELVLGGSEFLLCCACSAGPAFEGGDISFGMRATKGAIESCVIDKETMEPRLSIIGPQGTSASGICGSGIIDIISELFRCGIISSRGRFIRDGKRVKRTEYEASYVLSFAEETGGKHDIELCETDIDNFIRAKAAIFSAVHAMLGAVDMGVEDIDKVYLAGGIGSGIDISKAIRIGMLPDLPLDKYTYIGNSSLTGACAMLLSAQAEWRAHKLGRGMTYLELSSYPGYMDEFVAACFLPHTNASLFPNNGE